MELKEVYEKIGGDYDDVVRRLMGEKLVRKFLLKFLAQYGHAIPECPSQRQALL